MVRPTSFTNSVFQLAIVATPIDRAHYALCMVSAHAHWPRTCRLKSVHGICLSCTIMQMQGARGVCALRALVLYVYGTYVQAGVQCASARVCGCNTAQYLVCKLKYSTDNRHSKVNHIINLLKHTKQCHCARRFMNIKIIIIEVHYQ